MSDDFSVEDGWLHEDTVRDLAAWYHEKCPGTSQLAFEAHLMVLRAAVAVRSDSPIDQQAGVTRARYNILRMLYQAPDRRLLMSDMVQGMNVIPTNITKLVDSLAADGFVTRSGHEIDKRRTWAHLTDAGAMLVENALPRVSNHVTTLWECLEPEEQAILVHLLSKMRMNWFGLEKKTPADILRDLAATS
jgi:DNA-binding MarR family transcriptional regulator